MYDFCNLSFNCEKVATLTASGMVAATAPTNSSFPNSDFRRETPARTLSSSTVSPVVVAVLLNNPNNDEYNHVFRYRFIDTNYCRGSENQLLRDVL